MGAAAGNKQIQGPGNSLGIAAVLLHGAQGNFSFIETKKKNI